MQRLLPPADFSDDDEADEQQQYLRQQPRPQPSPGDDPFVPRMREGGYGESENAQDRSKSTSRQGKRGDVVVGKEEISSSNEERNFSSPSSSKPGVESGSSGKVTTAADPKQKRTVNGTPHGS